MLKSDFDHELAKRIVKLESKLDQALEVLDELRHTKRPSKHVRTRTIKQPEYAPKLVSEFVTICRARNFKRISLTMILDYVSFESDDHRGKYGVARYVRLNYETTSPTTAECGWCDTGDDSDTIFGLIPVELGLNCRDVKRHKIVWVNI